MKSTLPILLLPFLLAACSEEPPPAPEWHPPAVADVSRPLSLEEALSLARQSDVRAQSWRARMDQAAAGVSLAKQIPNPVLSVTWEDFFLPARFDPHNLSFHTTQATMPIFAWWLQPSKVDAAEATVRSETQARRAEERALAVEVGAAWIRLAADAKRIAATRELRENAVEAQRLVEKLRSLGMNSDFQVERSSNEVLATEAAVADAERTLRADQLAFAFALGAERPAFPEAGNPDVAEAFAGAATADAVPDDLLAATLAGNPDLAKALAARESAEAALRTALRSAFPLADVNLVAGYKHAAEGYAPLLGIEAPLPIFNWNGAGISRAEADLLAARAEEERARRAVIAGVCTNWERVVAAAEKWKRFAHPASERLAKLEASARKLFDAGEIEYSEYLIARRDAASARIAEIDAWAAAATAGWTLECALGRHDPP